MKCNYSSLNQSTLNLSSYMVYHIGNSPLLGPSETGRCNFDELLLPTELVALHTKYPDSDAVMLHWTFDSIKELIQSKSFVHKLT